jgi:hypothetical protein
MNNSLFTNSLVGNHFKNVQTTIFSIIFFKSPNSTCDKGYKCWQQFKSMGNKQFFSYFQQFQFLALYLFVHKKCGFIKLHKLGQESINILHFEISCKINFKNEKNSTKSNILWQLFCIFKPRKTILIHWKDLCGKNHLKLLDFGQLFFN